jgi:hypothetical protein
LAGAKTCFHLLLLRALSAKAHTAYMLSMAFSLAYLEAPLFLFSFSCFSICL